MQTFFAIPSRFSALRLLFAAALLAGAPLPATAQATDWKEVRIASEGARPPYNYLNADNQLDGFEIELGRELCARMKVTCTFVQQDWEGMIPNLRAKQYDAIMAAMEITDARLQKIAFTKAYLRMPSALVSARRRQIRDASPEALKGRTIGVASGTPQESYLEERYPESTVKTYESNEDAILDLAEGRIDAVLGEKDALTDFLKARYEAKCCKFLADVPRDPAYFGEGIGIGLRQEDSDLKAMFNKALDDMTADGTYAKIASKYFEFDVR
ncbi:MAG: Extracellular solute-binding protein family 3 [Hyphomicrobiales bacterium]|nr:Extracellular solute-binding protein family 3 [Hyphomicrobiales bacterium]